MTASVTVEMGGVITGLAEIQDLIAGEKRDIMQYGRSLMKSETERAFSRKADPETGRPWPRRKHSYPWPLLNHTGKLQNIVEFSYGVKTRNGKAKFFGKVEEGFASGNYTRGGGGISLGARKPWIVVVSAVHHGRKRGRSSAMWKPKQHGYLRTRGRMVFHGGGTRLQTGSSTGNVPPRPIFGFGSSARSRLRRYAEKTIAKVLN